MKMILSFYIELYMILSSSKSIKNKIISYLRKHILTISMKTSILSYLKFVWFDHDQTKQIFFNENVKINFHSHVLNS